MKMKLKRRDQFIGGGIILVVLAKFSKLEQQPFGVAALCGFIVIGAIVGIISYMIFRRKKKK